ncbi:hypothetical protein HMPREF9120_00800 [Neisseria sp. oral taxon 020 str. F0370]|nr:hypothetical protein HMPREF9120_00800 [Neisseria sp. oral taxon 020 str. F0370]
MAALDYTPLSCGRFCAERPFMAFIHYFNPAVSAASYCIFMNKGRLNLL